MDGFPATDYMVRLKSLHRLAEVIFALYHINVFRIFDKWEVSHHECLDVQKEMNVHIIYDYDFFTWARDCTSRLLWLWLSLKNWTILTKSLMKNNLTVSPTDSVEFTTANGLSGSNKSNIKLTSLYVYVPTFKTYYWDITFHKQFPALICLVLFVLFVLHLITIT